MKNYEEQYLVELDKNEIISIDGGAICLVTIFLASFVIGYTIGKDVKCACR